MAQRQRPVTRTGSAASELILLLVERELADIEADLKLASASNMHAEVASCLEELGDIREHLLVMTGGEALASRVNQIIARYVQ